MSQPFESINKIKECPEDGNEFWILQIRPHWSLKDRVVISINNKDIGVYLSDEIKRAVDNCTNAHRI